MFSQHADCKGINHANHFHTPSTISHGSSVWPVASVFRRRHMICLIGTTQARDCRACFSIATNLCLNCSIDDQTMIADALSCTSHPVTLRNWAISCRCRRWTSSMESSWAQGFSLSKGTRQNAMSSFSIE
jgi:hypothetical protein